MEVDFTAGITLNSGQVFTVDVARIDSEGVHYKSEGRVQLAAWSDIKALMLATTDHMLETSGYLFSMAEMVREREQAQPYDAAQTRRLALGLLAEAAPRICPLGEGCGLSENPPQ